MKLNLFIIKDELRDFEAYVYCRTDSQLYFNRFEVYRGQTLERNCLYLIDAAKMVSDLLLQEGISFACYGTLKNSVLQYRRCALVMLPTETLSSESTNRIASIFSKYAQWSEELLSLAVANDGIRQIFKSGLIEKVFQGPVMMQSGNELFAISCGVLPDDYDGKRWTNIISMGQPDMESVDYEQRALEKTIKDPFTFEKSEKYTLLATNMFSEGRFSGRLIHCKLTSEVTEGYLSLASYFSSILEELIDRNLNDGIVAHGTSNVFVELLGAWHTDKAWLDMQLNNIGWNRQIPACLIVFASGSDGLLASITGLISESISRLFPNDYVFSYRGDILAVIQLNDEKCSEENLKIKLEATPFATDAIIAVSSQFFDVSKLRSAYKQCRFLIDSETMSSENHVRFYGDAFFRHFITSYGIDRDYGWLVHQRVMLLNIYDRKNDSNFVDCLKTIIECGFRKKEAAEKLCVHHNTITYKLNKIKAISGIDLDTIGLISEDELFHILLSCKLLSTFKD